MGYVRFGICLEALMYCGRVGGNFIGTGRRPDWRRGVGVGENVGVSWFLATSGNEWL